MGSPVKTQIKGQITGKIRATSNSIYFGQRCVISWDTNDPAGGGVRVLIGANDGKLVAQGGTSGQLEIPWIADSAVYDPYRENRGDVNYLFLEVLPRLKPGVIVHVRDIFLPFEYRRDWVLDEFCFWTEQYLLQAFLTFNSEFEVLMANSYLNHYHQGDLKAAFPDLPSWGGGSFWTRRRSPVN